MDENLNSRRENEKCLSLQNLRGFIWKNHLRSPGVGREANTKSIRHEDTN
jgi:hypothetical protein